MWRQGDTAASSMARTRREPGRQEAAPALQTAHPMIRPLASTSLLLLTVAGCSSLDDDVFPEIAPQPHLSFDSTEPDSLAEFDIDVILLGGNRDRTVELSRADLVEFAEPHLTIPLVAELDDFDGRVAEDDEVTAALVNVGTTAEQLVPLCSSRAFGVRVGIRMLSDPAVQRFNLPEPIDVTCR
jgi:hypothetical protein